MREHKKQGGSRAPISVPEGVELFSLEKAGKKTVDIIPFKAGKGNPYADPGHEHFERTYYVHNGVGPNNEKHACLAKTFNKPCPICEYVSKLWDGDEDDKKLASQLGPKERQLFNVIDLNDKDKGIQIWETPYRNGVGELIDERIEQAEEDDEDYQFFADPEEGLSLKLTVSEDSYNNRTFHKVTIVDFVKRSSQYESSIVEEASCLDEILIETPYQRLKDLFFRTAEADEDEDEDETPKSKSKSKRRTAPPKAKDEDLEDEDLEDEDFDDEDEDEEDDEDEDLDDEDEDEEDDEDEDLDDEDEDLDDEDEDLDDDWGDDEDEDEEEPPPKKKPSSKKKTPPKSKKTPPKKSSKGKGGKKPPARKKR